MWVFLLGKCNNLAPTLTNFLHFISIRLYTYRNVSFFIQDLYLLVATLYPKRQYPGIHFDELPFSLLYKASTPKKCSFPVTNLYQKVQHPGTYFDQPFTLQSP